jgi:hypothetical protein
MKSHSQKPTFSEQPDIGRKMDRSISLLGLVGFLCKWLGSTKIWGQLGAKTRAFEAPIWGSREAKATDSTGLLVGAVGIETTYHWHFNDLRSKARSEKEGLGSPWNPYCRLNAAFFPMMLRTTLRFASRTAFGIAWV